MNNNNRILLGRVFKLRFLPLFLLLPLGTVVFLAVQIHFLDFSHHPGALDSGLRAKVGVIDPYISALTDDPELIPLLEILQRGGYELNDTTIFNSTILKMLPKWSTINEFYGPPVIKGLETCEAFNKAVPWKDRRLAIAGMFNSGTNLMYSLLQSNCRNPKSGPSGMVWQVIWGKHYPADYRGKRVAREEYVLAKLTPENLMPVVTIRDPYTWMQSMCRQPYQARFDYATNACPNLIPTADDIHAHPRFGKMKYMPVRVTYSRGILTKHLSLASLWNDWYRLYLNATFPRLIVRLEDIVFHADEVLPQVCKCFGGTVTSTIHHQKNVSNQNVGIEVDQTMAGLLKSIIRYGNVANRRKGYPDHQLQAAKDLLDEDLMNMFGYRYEEPAGGG